MKKVAILGFGVVGSGTADMLVDKEEKIFSSTGEHVEVKYILDIRSFPDSRFAESIVHDFAVIENDPEIAIVAEVIGGASVAYDFTKRALLKGKSVVTSNKELVAKHGAELLNIAKENNCHYLFEASVGGGIPVLHPILADLAHNDISEISGILNGTTNYILTRMFTGGATFADSLAEAQANGYAEANPEADIEGHDACRKIAILTALATGEMVPTDAIYTEGITKIRKSDVLALQKTGASIKLLGRMVKTAKAEQYVLVAPFVIGEASPLSHVSGVYNGVSVTGDFVGDVMFYGRGAGSYPTASAVVADICTLLADNAPTITFRVAKEDVLTPFSSFACRRYYAFSGTTEEAVRAIFGQVDFLDSEETAFIAPVLREIEASERVRRLEETGAVCASCIRVY